jgi:hypothetical protein
MLCRRSVFEEKDFSVDIALVVVVSRVIRRLSS